MMILTSATEARAVSSLVANRLAVIPVRCQRCGGTAARRRGALRFRLQGNIRGGPQTPRHDHLRQTATGHNAAHFRRAAERADLPVQQGEQQDPFVHDYTYAGPLRHTLDDVYREIEAL